MQKAWQSKYCLLFNASKLGIERLEVYDNKENHHRKEPPNKIFTLENCIKISEKDQLSLTIITKTWTQHFGTHTTTDLTNWITAFQSVAFKDDSCNLTIVEDNELYCSSGEGVFTVKLLPSDASKRCGLESKEYILVISSTSMKLKDFPSSKTLFTWPHRYIRRYGYRGGKFTFEAGRKCDSGEGSFHLEHRNHQEIFRCLSSKMKSMRKLINEEAIDCGDNQFQAALSMEARSRSPLPPSPTSATKSEPSSFESGPIIKPKPIKPPRKNIPTPSNPDYEPISAGLNYDLIEIRKEAWKTMGVDDVTHSESEISPTTPPSMTKSLENLSDIPPPVAKVITTKVMSDDNYYKLQFFGSKSQLDDLEGYQQVVVPKSGVQQPSTSYALDDYEEVQGMRNEMESVRLADDSHLGYGMIRKQNKDEGIPQVLQQLTPHIPHHVVNDNEYAIISKPKRV